MQRHYPLIEYLQQHGFIDTQMADSLRATDSYDRVRTALADSGLLSYQELDRLESLWSGFPMYPHASQHLDATVQSMVPFEFSQQHRVVCVDYRDGSLCLVTDQPFIDPEVISQLEYPVHSVHRAGDKQVDQWLDQYSQQTEQSLYNSILNTAKQVRTIESYGSKSMAQFFPNDHLQEIAEDLSSLKLLRRLVMLAAIKQSQGVVLRPTSDKLTVNLVYGDRTQEMIVLDKTIEGSLYLKLRYLADLPLDQPGSVEEGIVMGLDPSAPTAQYRVQFVPHTVGVTMTIRPAVDGRLGMSLDQLGISLSDQETVRNWLRRPRGLVVSTGLSASGKTFAAYHLLEAATASHQVATLEEDIEYVVDHVDQIAYSQRPEKDLQAIGDSYDVFGFLPFHSSITQAVYNLAQHKLCVVDTAHGVMGVIKRLLQLGVDPRAIAHTVRGNVISYRYTALDTASHQGRRLESGERSTIEELYSVEEFVALLHQAGEEGVRFTSWADVSWYEDSRHSSSWWSWTRHTVLPHQESHRYIRSVVNLEPLLNRALDQNSRLVDVEYAVKQEQKRSLLGQSLVAAYRGEIPISEVLAMVRS